MKTRYETMAVAALILLLGGCASTPQMQKVKEIYVCAGEECGPAGQTYNTTQMLFAVYQLLKQNEGKDIKICDSDPQKRNCESEGISYFVMSGVGPGMGSIKSSKMEDVELDLPGQTVTSKANRYMRFVGTPLACVPHPSVLSVRSADEITIVDDSFFCNWMVIGNMSANISFAIESVDFDKGQMGAYWTSRVAGTGYGQGSGYAVLQFAEAMPRKQNWLKTAEDLSK